MVRSSEIETEFHERRLTAWNEQILNLRSKLRSDYRETIKAGHRTHRNPLGEETTVPLEDSKRARLILELAILYQKRMTGGKGVDWLKLRGANLAFDYLTMKADLFISDWLWNKRAPYVSTMVPDPEED